MSAIASPACKLCGNTATPLCDSHIFPDFYIERMKHKKVTGEAGQKQPFLILKSTNPAMKDGAKQGRAWEKEVGLKEKLLCLECEKKISGYEAYARELLYGTTPQPIAKLKLGTSVFPTGVKLDPLLDARKVVGLDYRRLKLYQISIIWRASVASGSFYKDVSLGDRHESQLQKMLLHGDPGPPESYCCAMLDLQHNGKGCEDFTHQPERGRDEETGERTYKIIMGGYMYVFHISSESTSEMVRHLSVNSNGEIDLPP